MRGFFQVVYMKPETLHTPSGLYKQKYVNNVLHQAVFHFKRLTALLLEFGRSCKLEGWLELSKERDIISV